MSPEVLQAFEGILRQEGLGRSLLEVGALAGPGNLLQQDCVAGVPERLGVNLEGGARGEGWEILPGDAHDLSRFPDGRFDTVLCNSTLEHDPHFWKSLSEIRRVTAPGGLVVIGVPGFAGMGLRALAPGASFWRRLARGILRGSGDPAWGAGALTLGEHRFPGDYYRFTEQAVREVLMEGLMGVRSLRVMHPPRFIGWGRKPWN